MGRINARVTASGAAKPGTTVAQNERRNFERRFHAGAFGSNVSAQSTDENRSQGQAIIAQRSSAGCRCNSLKAYSIRCSRP
jgi:hypothetical protein